MSDSTTSMCDATCSYKKTSGQASASQQRNITSAGLPRAGGWGSSLPHVRQLHNWDCGLACVLMVLQGGAPVHSSALDLLTLRRYCQVTRCTSTIMRIVEKLKQQKCYKSRVQVAVCPYMIKKKSVFYNAVYKLNRPL